MIRFTEGFFLYYWLEIIFKSLEAKINDTFTADLPKGFFSLSAGVKNTELLLEFAF